LEKAVFSQISLKIRPIFMGKKYENIKMHGSKPRIEKNTRKGPKKDQKGPFFGILRGGRGKIHPFFSKNLEKCQKRPIFGVKTPYFGQNDLFCAKLR
jgi:hypothetical protein